MAFDWFGGEERQHSLDLAHHVLHCLRAETQHEQAGVLLGRVLANVSKVQSNVSSAPFLLTARSQVSVSLAGQALVSGGVGLVTRVPEDGQEGLRLVLVKLQPHRPRA